MTRRQKLLATKKVVNMNLKVHRARETCLNKSLSKELKKVQDARIVSTVHKKKGFKKRKVVEVFEKWQFAPITFPFTQNREMNDMPLVIWCKIANTGITIMKIHVDTGSSIDLIYEQCFRQLPECIKADLKPTAISLSGFAGESAWPMGQLSLEIELCNEIEVKLTRKTCGNNKFYDYACAAISTQDTVVAHKFEEDNTVVVNPKYVDQKIKIGAELNAKIRRKIVQLLVAYMDVFAWSEQDMTEVPRNVAEHRLNANPALKPIVQKRRGMAPDRMKWLSAKVAKLVNAGILREVKYQTWVANPVLVKKPDGSWRMCIDFKDINKACPKDNYPLPEIDLKVESLHAYPYKCFLDAAKGYHQIPIALEDEDKTAFHTGKGCASCA
ncbi:uncharacterized protein [Rutidosis leptorrhynchoides]|uniref:uncharacterized protein n=1 Tax=Rutidosis leptorrhynchoides TaxID=125765 RepID=UPI003A9A072B